MLLIKSSVKTCREPLCESNRAILHTSQRFLGPDVTTRKGEGQVVAAFINSTMIKGIIEDKEV